MSTTEEKVSGVRYFEGDSVVGFSDSLRKMFGDISNEDIFFVCIGTNRIVGDAVGPMIGSELSKLGYTNLIGTMEKPINGVNFEERLKEIPEDKIVIAIDSCLTGIEENVGTVGVTKGGMQAGSAVGKDLPVVGDYTVKAVIAVGSDLSLGNFFAIKNTPSSTVEKLVDIAYQSIAKTFPVEQRKEGIS